MDDLSVRTYVRRSVGLSSTLWKNGGSDPFDPDAVWHRRSDAKEKQKKTALANKTIYTLIWYAFYDLQPGNGVGAILTALEPTPCTVRETYAYGT